MTDEPQIHVLPQSRQHIAAIQSARKRVAFERAKTAPWYKGRLDHIRVDRLDDPEEWQKIPILDKETLRQFDHNEFTQQLCVATRGQVAEYWRSGGTTGRPVFYPRTYDDVRFALVSWGRSFPCMGINSEDLCHLSFPLGIHPAGQVWARSAQLAKVGMIWVGAGNVVPSIAQLELIRNLRPTVVMGMSSFVLHLASLAQQQGIELQSLGIRKLVCTAESLSSAKRKKLKRQWGAEVFDVFGMSEAGLMGAENSAHDGIHIWTDLYYVEVVDPDTGEQLPPGDVGTFCVTPLWTNHATPFLRWNSGDLVSYVEHSSGTGTYADLFPMIRHAHRTTGFFKVRGVNINHTEFEDLMFHLDDVVNFQVILETDAADDRETLRIRLESSASIDQSKLSRKVANIVKNSFEITPLIDLVPMGTLAAEFEKSIKAPRFLDQRI